MQEPELERAIKENEILAGENERLLRELREATERYADIRGSLSWRLTAPLRRFLDWVRRPESKNPLPLSDENYRKWVNQFDRLTEADRVSIRAGIQAMTHRTMVSLLLTVKDPDGEALAATLQSIRRQLYPDWELCIVDDMSAAPHVARTLADAGGDSRVRIERRSGGDPLAMASAEFVALIDAGDVLSESALFEIAMEIEAYPDCLAVYSDEDALDARGERCKPRFKTGWNPDLLLEQDYFGKLTVYRRTAYGLALRSADALQVRHVAAVLCHRRNATEPAVARYRPPLTSAKVTAIIPTRERADLLERSVDGLLNRTKYPAIEVIVVDNNSKEESTRTLLARYETLENMRVLRYGGEFNWSAMNNAGAAVAEGEILLFLNNDIEVIAEDWLSELASHAVRDGVGAVGAKLLFPDHTVQHAGIWLGPGVFLRHLLRLSKRADRGYGGQLSTMRNVSAVTGACMAVRRDIFKECGGFDESFPVSYNDIDFCLRLIDKGYRIVWTPHAELLHLESASRGSGAARWRKEEADRDRFVARWRRQVDEDPFFNPNLDLIGEETLALAYAPRRKRAWQRS